MNNKIHHERGEETLLIRKKTRGEEKGIRRWKQLSLTCHYRVKNLCPLLSTNGTASCDQLVTRRIDGVRAGSAEKWSETKTTESGNHRGAPLEVSSFQ